MNETSRNHTRNQNMPDLSWHSKSLSLANFPNNLLITIKGPPKNMRKQDISKHVLNRLPDESENSD